MAIAILLDGSLAILVGEKAVWNLFAFSLASSRPEGPKRRWRRARRDGGVGWRRRQTRRSCPRTSPSTGRGSGEKTFVNQARSDRLVATGVSVLSGCLTPAQGSQGAGSMGQTKPCPAFPRSQAPGSRPRSLLPLLGMARVLCHRPADSVKMVKEPLGRSASASVRAEARLGDVSIVRSRRDGCPENRTG